MHIYLTIFFCLLSTIASPHASEQLHLQHLRIEDGLSHHSTTSQFIDSRGFLWVGTENGLNRYDGYEFVSFHHDPMDSTTISSNRVRGITEDKQGQLWLATQRGIDKFDRLTESFKHYDLGFPPDLIQSPVCVIADDHKNIWVGVGLSQLVRLSPDTHTQGKYHIQYHTYNSPSSIAITQVLYIDSHKRLWVGTDHGLWYFDDQKNDLIAYGKNDNRPSVTAITEDKQGHLWLGTTQGLLRINPYAKPSMPPTSMLTGQELADPHIRALHFDSSETLWIGLNSGGIAQLPKNSTRPDIHKHNPQIPNSLSNNSVVHITQGREGVLFFATYGGGISFLSKRDHQRFTRYEHIPNNPLTLNSSSIFSIYEDRAGTFWVGTDDGLHIFNRQKGTVETVYKHIPSNPKSIAHSTARALYEDRAGTFWVGTDDGLHIFNRQKGTVETVYKNIPSDPKSIAHNTIRAILEDTNKTLWIGTAQGGISALNRSLGTFQNFLPIPNDPHSLSHTYVRTIHEEQNILWIGTVWGLNRFDPAQKHFVRYFNDPNNAHSLSHNSIYAIASAGNGNLWIGTYNGLNYYHAQTNTFTHFTTKDGLPTNIIYSIRQDQQNNLWLGTDQGISRAQVTIKNDIVQCKFRNYGPQDGVAGYEFNAGASFIGQDGLLAFGGMNGLNIFYPSKIPPDNQHVPPIVFTHFQLLGEGTPQEIQQKTQKALNGQSIIEAEKIVFTHPHYRAQFRFSALDYTHTQQNKYAYQLKGLDESWSELGTRREIDFGFSPGNYILTIRGANNDGTWNNKGRSLQIEVKAPFWAQWWFRTLAIALVGGIALVTHRLIVRQIKQRNAELNAQIFERQRVEKELEQLIQELEGKNAELERFTYTVSHDLKSPIVTIEGFLGLLEKDAQKGDFERLQHDLNFIRSATKNMHNLLEDLTELSRIGRVINASEEVNLTELSHEVVTLLQSRITKHKVTIHIDETLPTVYADRTRLREVFQNLIENACKFMGDQPKPHISISQRQQDNEHIILIHDNGQGIDPRYHKKVFNLFERLNANEEGTGIGLALVKRIVEHHGWQIWVESRGAKLGSTFCIALPKSQNKTDV